jgi:uncharacterized protein (DUF2062 family)
VFYSFVRRGAKRMDKFVRGFHVVWRRLRANNLTPAVLATSSAVGLAVGVLPLYGLHGVIVAGVCLLFRLDAVLAFTATMISNPFTFPFLTWLEVRLGCKILGGLCPRVEDVLQGQGLTEVGYPLFVGASVASVVVGGIGALIVGGVAHWWQARTRLE